MAIARRLQTFKAALIVQYCHGVADGSNNTITKLDGLTGNVLSTISVNHMGGPSYTPKLAVHLDGTIFLVVYTGSGRTPRRIRAVWGWWPVVDPYSDCSGRHRRTLHQDPRPFPQ